MEPQSDFTSVDEIIAIIVDGSAPFEPLPAISPPLSEEKKEFLKTIDQFQRRYTGRSLSWGEIFDVLVSLGYRKVEQPNKPSQANGEPKEDADGDGTVNEKPS
ncbi:MAG: hypothetical protein ACYC3I_00595 [Gemmataceae bacterium]